MLFPSSVEIFKTRSYDVHKPRLKRASTSSRFLVFEASHLNRLVEVLLAVGCVGQYLYHFPCCASCCCIEEAETEKGQHDTLEERDLIFGPLRTIVTSASSELGTDCSWQVVENEQLNSIFLLNISLLTIVAALER